MMVLVVAIILVGYVGCVAVTIRRARRDVAEHLDSDDPVRLRPHRSKRLAEE